jgi:hypothetical protein
MIEKRVSAGAIAPADTLFSITFPLPYKGRGIKGDGQLALHLLGSPYCRTLQPIRSV